MLEMAFCVACRKPINYFERIMQTNRAAVSSLLNAQICEPFLNFGGLACAPCEAEASLAYEVSVFKEFSLERYKEARECLPVVPLCFVGRGRVGKTTTLRREDQQSIVFLASIFSIVRIDNTWKIMDLLLVKCNQSFVGGSFSICLVMR